MINSKIGIIVPAYDEHQNILNLIKKIRRITRCTILIVDDSPNNKTKNIINELTDKNVIYIHRKKKLGRGSAVLLGLKKLYKYNKRKIKYFIEMDADLSHNPIELNKKVKIFLKKKLDLLISSRYLRKSEIKNWTYQRKILSKISNLLVRVTTQIHLTDFTNGYRIYSKKAVSLILKHCKNSKNDFILLSEIILILYIYNLKISEKSTIFKNRTKGKSNVNIKLILKSLLGLIKLFFMKKKFLKVMSNK